MSTGSAYAGHVRPRGIFSVFGNVRLFYLVGAAIMLGSLGIGGFIASNSLGSGDQGSSSRNPAGFVDQSDEDPDANDGTPEPNATSQEQQYSAPPAVTIDASKTYTATIKTAEGDIEVELLAAESPTTVNNFVFLAREGFYDGLAFFFVDDQGTYAQAGDPDCTSAGANVSTCDGGPGYDLPQERPGAFAVGTLGMVNGSQFFITLGESDRFEQYTPFGRITSGLDVAEQLARGTKIESVEIAEQ